MSKPPEVTTVKSHKEMAKKRSKNDPVREAATERLKISPNDIVTKVKIDRTDDAYPDYCIIYKYDENTSAWSIGNMDPATGEFVEVKPFVLKFLMAKTNLLEIVERQNRREDWNDPSSVIIPDTKLWNMICTNKQSIPEWLVEARNFKQFMDVMEREWKRRNQPDNFTINASLILESKRAPCVPPPYYLPHKASPKEKDDGFVVPDGEVEEEKEEVKKTPSPPPPTKKVSEAEVEIVKVSESKKKKEKPVTEESSSKRQKVSEPEPAPPVSAPKAPPFSEICKEPYTYYPLTRNYKNTKAAVDAKPEFESGEKIVSYLQSSENVQGKFPALARLVCLMEAIAFRKEFPEELEMKLPGLSKVEIHTSISVASTRDLLLSLNGHLEYTQSLLSEVTKRITQETKLYAIFMDECKKKGILNCLVELYQVSKLKFNWLLYLAVNALGNPSVKEFKEILRENKITSEIPSMHKMVKKKMSKKSKKSSKK